MTKDATPLLELDDALALWRWAWAELENPRDPSYRRSRGEIAEGLLDILTFVACELSLAGHHEWIEQLPEMVRMYDGWLMCERSPRDKCVEAIGALLCQDAPVTKTVRAMARSGDPRERAVIARNLQLADADARALLETLTTDTNRHVRGAARERLPASQPTAWWVGTFDSDPIPRLPEADDELLAALRTVALFANRETSKEQEATLPELVEALPRLPDPILFEVAGRFVAFDWLAPGYVPMLDAVLRRRGGGAALWNMLAARLGRPHDWAHLCLMLQTLSSGLDDEPTEELCRGLLGCLVEHRHSRRARSMAHIVETALGRCWPASLPGALVLDAWQTLAGDTPELAKTLQPLLWHQHVDLRPELGRLLALAEDDKELVRPLSSAVSRLDPEARHAFVVRGLASESDPVRALALEQLAALPPDPASGSGAAAFTRYWAEPALRRAIVSDNGLSEVFCPYLRRQLRAGSLELFEVAATLRAIDRLWGDTESATEEEERAAKLEHAAAWHEGASETGPITEQEWEVWRALRRQKMDDDPDVNAPRLLLVRPAGPLHPDDREVIDWLMARWRRAWAAADDPSELSGEHFHRTFGLHYAISHIVDPHVLECLEEVLAALSKHDEHKDHLVRIVGEEVEKLRHSLAEAPKG